MDRGRLHLSLFYLHGSNWINSNIIVKNTTHLWNLYQIGNCLLSWHSLRFPLTCFQRLILTYFQRQHWSWQCHCPCALRIRIDKNPCGKSFVIDCKKLKRRELLIGQHWYKRAYYCCQFLDIVHPSYPYNRCWTNWKRYRAGKIRCISESAGATTNL